jgi:hypothetical protein
MESATPGIERDGRLIAEERIVAGERPAKRLRAGPSVSLELVFCSSSRSRPARLLGDSICRDPARFVPR